MTGKNSNGCSFVPDHDDKIHSCCDQHDKDYADEKITRYKADLSFRQCIIKSGHPSRAWIYWVGVRAFGWYFWGKK